MNHHQKTLHQYTNLMNIYVTCLSFLPIYFSLSHCHPFTFKSAVLFTTSNLYACAVGGYSFDLQFNSIISNHKRKTTMYKLMYIRKIVFYYCCFLFPNGFILHCNFFLFPDIVFYPYLKWSSGYPIKTHIYF